MSFPATTTPRAAGTVAPHNNVTSLYSDHHQPLLAQPPRSSSLPFASSLQMGSSQSKPAPPPNTPSSSNSPASSTTSSAVKGITAAAVTGGFKLKRAFAARRKKSEDASSVFNSLKGKEPEAASRAATSARGGDGQALSSQVVDRSSVPLPPPLSLSQQPQRMDTTSSPATSPSPRSQVFNKNVISPALPSPPPPTPPPKKETPPSISSTLPTDVQVLSAAGNRNSISPGISSYLSMIDQQQSPQSPQSPQPQNAGGTTIISNLTSKVDSQAEKENLQSSTSSSGSSGSGTDKRDMKESWRKSDSTNSHHTIRPGAGSARTSRPVSWAESFQSAYTVVQPGTTSRPLSALMGDADFGMLEEDDGDSSQEAASFSSSSHGQRKETEKEKDAKSSPTSSLRSKAKRDRRSMSLSIATPYTSAAAANFKQGIVIPPAPPSASAVETSMVTAKIHPSMSISEGLPPGSTTGYKTPRPPPVIAPSASQPQPQIRLQAQGKFISSPHPHPSGTSASSNTASMYLQHERSLPALPQHPPHPQQLTQNSHPQSRSPQVHTHFQPLSVHPTSAQPQPTTPTSGLSHSHTPTPTRTPAISMSAGGLGPAAAGLAKRAVEKMSMGKKWMGLALSHSASGGQHNHSHEQSTSEGYSSSSSTSGSVNNPGEYGSGGFGFGLARTNSNTSASGTSNSHYRHHSFFSSSPSKSIPGGGGQHKRTANAASSISSTDSDPFYSNGGYPAQEGPILGRKLRGPLGVPAAGMRSNAQMKGWVFKRDLASCVRDTRVTPGSGSASVRRREDLESLSEKEREKELLIRDLEEWALPALVVRCAQHLLVWGVKEEGLFRVTGMPSHVAKLRSEFDSGADYDMTECTPGDLDPHAVASVFRAYLRELPEPILTHKLQPYFDAAISKEASNNASETTTASANPARMSMVMGAGPGRPIVGLPSGPKSGFHTYPNGSMFISNPIGLRKPPSLSTLAMPSFSVPPPSMSLTAAIRKLVLQLPKENRDLMRTIVELIQATSKEVKETKMPLSNLLVVFTPTLGMSPSLLRALCEAEGIWVDEERVIDIRRRTVIIGPSPDAAVTEEVEDRKEKVDEVDTEEEEGSVISGSGRASLDTTDNSLSSDYQASVEDDTSSSLSMSVPMRPEEQEGEEAPRLRHGSDYERAEVPTMYLSTKSHCSTASSISSRDGEEEEEQVPTATPHVNSFVKRDRDYQHQQQQYMTDDALSVLSTSSSPPIPPLLSSSAESVVTPTSSGNSSLADLVGVNQQQEKKKVDDVDRGPPKIAESTPLELRPQGIAGTVLFPSQQSQQAFKPVPSPSPASASSTSLAAKRRSIPTLSLPSLSLPAVAYTPSPSSSVPTPSSALASPRSFGEKEKDNEKKTLRTKKPSLKLLFSKRSVSSLKSGKDKELGGHGWVRASTGMSFISAPIPQQQQSPGQTPLQQQCAVYRGSPNSASDSSVSTPLSAVTAPQSSLPSSAAASRSVSAAGSTADFPPVLDTPIEGPSLSLDYGFDIGPPTTAMLEEMIKTSSAAAAKEEEARTQEAINASQSHVQDQAPTRRAVMGRAGMQKPLNLPAIEPLSIHHKDKGATPALRPQASTSNLSIMSTESSNHLNMFEDDEEEEEEDWTQSVLLAADSVDGSWAIQRPAGSGSGGVGSSSTKF